MKKSKITAFIILSALVVAACSRAFDPDVRTGAGQMLAEDAPEVRLSALGYFDDDGQPVIDIETEVVIGSLVFSSSDGVFTASAGVQLHIYKLEDEDDDRGERVETIEEGFKIEDEDSGIRTSNESYTLSKQVKAEPGKYRVRARVVDQDSRQASETVANVIVSDPSGDQPVLTHVKILGSGKSKAADFPVTTYSIPARMDSLKFRYKVSRAEEHEPVDVNMRLIRFESDNEPPRRMSQPQPTRGSIYFRGINYNEKEIIEQQTRTLAEETGTIEIEYRTPLPDRGAYRFEVTLADEGERDSPRNVKARDFGVVSPNFPNIKSVREMAQAMVYLMPRSDYEEMMELTDEDSLKSKMDQFWLENLRNKETASQVIEKYFNRVEEANRQFTNFKEGWMTDLGMMYILFGPPYYVDRRVDRLTWIYGYDRNDPNRVFHFERARMDTDQYPFTHYVFLRDRYYHQVEYRQRQRWLSGVILNRPI